MLYALVNFKVSVDPNTIPLWYTSAVAASKWPLCLSSRTRSASADGIGQIKKDHSKDASGERQSLYYARGIGREQVDCSRLAQNV